MFSIHRKIQISSWVMMEEILIKFFPTPLKYLKKDCCIRNVEQRTSELKIDIWIGVLSESYSLSTNFPL